MTSHWNNMDILNAYFTHEAVFYGPKTIDNFAGMNSLLIFSRPKSRIQLRYDYKIQLGKHQNSEQKLL